MPKVSIVMPSLNVVKYIKECMDSVVNQTLKDIEIICVDAGSTDGTLEILKEYTKKDKRIKLIISDKKSYGYQMNLGIDAASGEYLGIVETDDYIKLNMYEKLYKVAKKNNVEVVKSDFKRFYGDKNNRTFDYACVISRKPKFYNQLIINPIDKTQLFFANNINPIGIYSLELIKKNNIKLHESLGASYQDNGLWFQIFMHASSFYFIDEAFYMLRRDNPNSSVKSDSKCYVMCDEYDFIRDKIKGNKQEEYFAKLCAYFRFGNYIWRLNNISYEYKYDFLMRISADFKRIKNSGELDKKLFGNDWNTLEYIINSPVEYYYAKLNSTTQELRRLENKLAFTRNSASYKIGRFITWLPRKIRQGVMFIKKEGFLYSVLRLCKKMGIIVPKCVSLNKSLSSQSTIKNYDYYAMLDPSEYKNALKEWFERVTKTTLNLDNPRTFNEKIQWLKLYDSTPLKTKLTDKYLVRKWVADKIGDEYLVPLLGVWDSFDEIDFNKLPNQFVLKVNNACGTNIIVKDKSTFNKQEAKEKIDKWMKENYAFKYGLELHYMNIPPKIIAEQYLEGLNGDTYDYKFMCYNGEAKFMWVNCERQIGNKKNFFDLEWNEIMDVTIGHYPRKIDKIQKPINFDKMIVFSKLLSKEFYNVRVDFYEINGKLYFGELTFTSESGVAKITPKEFHLQMGDWMKIPQEKLQNPEKYMFKPDKKVLEKVRNNLELNKSCLRSGDNLKAKYIRFWQKFVYNKLGGGALIR